MSDAKHKRYLLLLLSIQHPNENVVIQYDGHVLARSVTFG